MTVLRLAWFSLLNRKVTALLTVLSIALSVSMLLGVEKVRNGARLSFINTISGTDLIVGARTGDVQLLLSSVFHMGSANANLSWETVEQIRSRPEVKWLVPISLGDSHHGFRVVGTTAEYFQHFRYKGRERLAFADGGPFDDLFDAVIGSKIAAELGYRAGTEIVVAHGAGRILPGNDHSDKPFKVVGVLAATGTPVDRSVLIGMQAIEAIHVGWETGAAPRSGDVVSADDVRLQELRPKTATALMVGLESRVMTFSLQRWANSYQGEAISAVLPGIAFARLWQTLGYVETALLIITSIVVFTALLGMVISVLGSLNQRRREMAILRSLGARPLHVFGLLLVEAGSLVVTGTVFGTLLVFALLLALRAPIGDWTGLYFEVTFLTWTEVYLLIAILVGGLLAAIVPATGAYRLSLSDGLTVRT